MSLDISSNVQDYLLANSDIQSIVGSLIGSDSGFTKGWIFDTQAQTRIENTQKAALVVSYVGGWAPNEGNQRYPLVGVDIWQDPDRSEDNTPVSDVSAKSKAFDVFEVLIKAMNKIQPTVPPGFTFGATRVTSSELVGEPEIIRLEGGNGLLILRSTYAISTF